MRDHNQSHEQQAERDGQLAEPSEQPAGLTRRQILRSAAVALFFYLSPQAVKAHLKRARVKGRKHWPKAPRGVHNPRFVHKKSAHKRRKVKAVAVSLSPGFYLNPRSQVIHYVSSKRKIARVNKINERRLQPINPSELSRLMGNGAKPRINLSTSSHSLETAALSSLRAKDYPDACQLLVSAIRHDQFFKQATLEEPSWRLYDLLAGASVRFGQQPYFSQLLRLAETTQQRLGQPPVRRRAKTKAPRVGTHKALHPPRTHRKWKKQRKLAMKSGQASRKIGALKSRLKNWTAANSPWRRRWLDVKRQLKWMRPVI